MPKRVWRTGEQTRKSMPSMAPSEHISAFERIRQVTDDNEEEPLDAAALARVRYAQRRAHVPDTQADSARAHDRRGSQQTEKDVPMKDGLRRRFWPELGMGIVTAIMALITVIRRDWIEALFSIDPDRGTGSLEWYLVSVLLVATVALFSLAAYEWRRAALATA